MGKILRDRNTFQVPYKSLVPFWSQAFFIVNFMYQQDYRAYTIQQQQTWNILFTKRTQALAHGVATPFWQGVQALELKAYIIPEFQELNNRLKRLSDWEVVAIERPLRPRQILSQWSRKKFPALTNMRQYADVDLRLQRSQDLFSGVYGGLPWVFQPEISDFMHGLGMLSKQNPSPEATEVLWRLAHHVIGNGLLRDEEGRVTLLGSRLLTNATEGTAALQNENAWKPADLHEMLAQPCKKTDCPNQYFVLEELADLTAMLSQLKVEGLPLIEVPTELELVAL